MKRINNCIKWLTTRPNEIRRWCCRKLIKNQDFTIISNNCWAGKVYQYLDMPYLSPTVGLYFFADDYIRFIKNLRYYLSLDLQFIQASQSKHEKELLERKQGNIPIGLLDDVEIVFRHYKSPEEAREKWNRRKQRINWDNVFIKFSRMNGCTDMHICQFSELRFQNKFVFNIEKKPIYQNEIYWSGPQNSHEILLDTTPFPGNIPIVKLLNSNAEAYPEDGI